MPLRTRIGQACCALGIVLLLAATWLLVPRPRPGTTSARPLAIVLVDASASAVAPRPSWSAEVRARLASFVRDAQRDARSDAGDMCVIAFGDGARRAFGPAAASELGNALARRTFDPVQALLTPERRGGDARSDLAAALELARMLAADRSHARITVLGDGTCTGRDAAPIAAELAHAGIAIERADLEAPELANASLGPLVVPRGIESGAPLVATCDVAFAAGSVRADGIELQLDVVRRDARGESRKQVRVALPAGLAPDFTGTLHWPAHVDLGPATPGAIRLSARISVNARDGSTVPDAIAEDDESSAFVRCGGALVVGIVGDPAACAEWTASFPAPRAGLDFVELAPHDVAAALASLDALVTLDAPLDDAQCDLVGSFVQHGGGLLECLGWRSLTARGAVPPGTGRARWTGTSALVPAGDDLPPRDVVLLVDASGSMSGAPFEIVRAALTRLVESAPTRDGLEARFFAAELGPRIDLGAPDVRVEPAARKAAWQRLAAAHEPAGATHLWRALDDLVRERAGSGRTALVVLVTDGRDPERDNLAARGTALRERLSAARTKLAVIAVGADADRELLSALLAPGESLREAPDLAASGSDATSAARELASLFEREVARDLVREGAALHVLASNAPGALTEPIVRAQGDPGTWPAVTRFVRCRAANGAEVAWTSSAGEPLFALHAVGRGLAGALAFAPGSDWALVWRGRGDLLGPIVRALARPARAAREAGPEIADTADMGREIVLTNVPRDFPAEVRARCFASDRSVQRAGTLEPDASAERLLGTIALVAGRSGRDPLLERSASRPAFLSQVDGGLVRVSIEAGSAGTLELPLVLARAEEFAGLPRAFFPPTGVPPIDSQAPESSSRAAAGGGSAASSPAAPVVLGIALSLLLAAAILGSFAVSRN